MRTPPPAHGAFVLLATYRERSLAQLLKAQGYQVSEAPTGSHALRWARTMRPDVILLEDVLPDLTGVAVCRLLRADPEISQNVPVLIVAAAPPTPEQRVAALSAGAWDVLSVTGSGEFALRLDAYVQAKRSMELALADAALIPPLALHGRGGLTRRVRELGALMVRCRKPLACVAFEVDGVNADFALGSAIARAARISDVIGVLTPQRFALVAPATDAAGAVDLARRIHGEVTALGRRPDEAPRLRLVAGYDAAATVPSGADPALLLARAEHALRTGRPEPGQPWIRRHEAGGPQAPASEIVSSRRSAL